MKILLIRFSSIGDLVITTPVIRLLYQNFPQAEIHYVTKAEYLPLIANHPLITKVFQLEDSLHKLAKDLKNNHYDLVFDMHKNLRSSLLIRQLKYNKLISYHKNNWAKWLLVRFKIFPEKTYTVLGSYLNSLRNNGLKVDDLPYEIHLSSQLPISLEMRNLEFQKFAVFVLGAKFKTKQLPLNKWIELARKLEMQVVLLGGKEEAQLALEMEDKASSKIVFNGVGKLNLQQAIWCVKHAHSVYSNDTGFMHIACAFNKSLTVFWGSTVPDLGFKPYQPNSSQHIQNIEVPISCRPCSKLGFNECPKKHHNCMQLIDIEKININ